MNWQRLLSSYKLLDSNVVALLERPVQFLFVALLAIYLCYSSLLHLRTNLTITDPEIDQFYVFFVSLNETRLNQILNRFSKHKRFALIFVFRKDILKCHGDEHFSI